MHHTAALPEYRLVLLFGGLSRVGSAVHQWFIYCRCTTLLACGGVCVAYLVVHLKI